MPVKIAWYAEEAVLGCQLIGKLTSSELLEASRQLRARIEAYGDPVSLLFDLSHTTHIPASFNRLPIAANFLATPNCALVLLYEHTCRGTAQRLIRALTAALPQPAGAHVRQFSSDDATLSYVYTESDPVPA